MISQHVTTLVTKNKIAENTYQLIITKPTGFSFSPGQFMFLDFANPIHTDDRPSFRAMSIASAPHEEHLMFIMRGSESAFKKNIIAMKCEDEIVIKGPMGHIALPQNISQQIVLIVSGVGITPARSILKHEEHQNTNRSIVLLYINKRRDTSALYEELQQIQLTNYKPIFICTRETDDWDGETRHIDIEMIAKYVDDITNTMYYIVGTKVFADAMNGILDNMDIAKENIQCDNFG